MKLQLPNVTIVAVCGNRQAETVAALYKCLQQVTPAKTILFTNIDIEAPGIDVVKIPDINWEQYNRFIVKHIAEYITTSHVLVTQWDGYILDASRWTDEFLEYDYIGAAWLDGVVGNGGFSLRSLRLQQALADDTFIEITAPEDVAIGRLYKTYLQEAYDIQYAPKEIADRFSFELNEPMQPTFGFHAFHWPKFRETIVIKRSGAMGDVILTEPILHHFHRRGYQVALDTQPQFYNLFSSHFYPVAAKQHLNPSLPYKEINLDMAYESKPHQLRLHSYYDYAEVPMEERVIRNPRLSMSFPINDSTRLFKKYAVLHIDIAEHPHRRILDVDWDAVIAALKNAGYDTFIVGKGEKPKLKNGIEINTNEALLAYTIAGASLFIGADSGPSNIASAFDIPSIIFFGSVDPNIVHPVKGNKIYIHNHFGAGVCDKPFCYSSEITITGAKCYINPEQPPCTKYVSSRVLAAIYQIIDSK